MKGYQMKNRADGGMLLKNTGFVRPREDWPHEGVLYGGRGIGGMGV